jgi:hypothetical protein
MTYLLLRDLGRGGSGVERATRAADPGVPLTEVYGTGLVCLAEKELGVAPETASAGPGQGLS